MSSDAENIISPHLESGESIIWTGRPRQGIIFRASDTWLVPFSLIWCGFAIFWAYSAMVSNSPLFFKLIGISFVLMGVNFVVGRFLLDAKKRTSIYYGITNRRILIVFAGRTKHFKSLNLQTLTDISFLESANGRGTITFGSIDRWEEMQELQWAGFSNRLMPRFEQIENVKDVYTKIFEAQKII